MRLSKTAFALAVLLVGMVAGEPMLAHGKGGHAGGHRSGGAHSSARHTSGSPHFRGRHFSGSHVALGVAVGAPFFWYYPPSYYSLPVAAASLPTVYIEQADQQAYWYYCPETLTYYPYVERCPEGWQLMVPQPPG
jgi:hypothetical protein